MVKQSTCGRVKGTLQSFFWKLEVSTSIFYRTDVILDVWPHKTSQWRNKKKNPGMMEILGKATRKSCMNACMNAHIQVDVCVDAIQTETRRTATLTSHASRVMLKVLQARLQQCMNRELPDVQSGFGKGRGTRDQIANICWIIEKSKRGPEKHLFLLYWLCQSLWLCGSQLTVENSERDGNTRPPNLPPEKSLCKSRSNS